MGWRPAPLATLMMTPRFSLRKGMAAEHMKKVALRLTAITRS